MSRVTELIREAWTEVEAMLPREIRDALRESEARLSEPAFNSILIHLYCWAGLLTAAQEEESPDLADILDSHSEFNLVMAQLLSGGIDHTISIAVTEKDLDLVPWADLISAGIRGMAVGSPSREVH